MYEVDQSFLDECVKENKNCLVLRDCDNGRIIFEKTDFTTQEDARNKFNPTFIRVLDIILLKETV